MCLSQINNYENIRLVIRFITPRPHPLVFVVVVVVFGDVFVFCLYFVCFFCFVFAFCFVVVLVFGLFCCL